MEALGAGLKYHRTSQQRKTIELDTHRNFATSKWTNQRTAKSKRTEYAIFNNFNPQVIWIHKEQN